MDIYAPMLNHGEREANEYLANNLQPTTSLTIDEIKKEKGKDLIININYLFDLVDKAYNNNNKLINIGSFKENWDGDYKNNKQTDFGEKLKETLKSITSYCDTYIDKLFGNLKGDPYHNILNGSTYGCNGAYIYGNGVSEIKRLYKYLKEKDIEFKNSNISTFSNISKLADFKKELKQNLLLYLSQICQDKEKRVVIKNIVIPEGNHTRMSDYDLLLHQPVWVTDTIEHNNKVEKDNRDFYTQQGINFSYGKFNGGNTKITKTIKKEILGKERCIYKKSGDRKEYVKYKGDLITVSEYKKIMIAKNKK
jgi:hypothetical protein